MSQRQQVQQQQQQQLQQAQDQSQVRQRGDHRGEEGRAERSLEVLERGAGGGARDGRDAGGPRRAGAGEERGRWREADSARAGRRRSAEGGPAEGRALRRTEGSDFPDPGAGRAGLGGLRQIPGAGGQRRESRLQGEGARERGPPRVKSPMATLERAWGSERSRGRREWRGGAGASAPGDRDREQGSVRGVPGESEGGERGGAERGGGERGIAPGGETKRRRRGIFLSLWQCQA